MLKGICDVFALVSGKFNLSDYAQWPPSLQKVLFVLKFRWLITFPFSSVSRSHSMHTFLPCHILGLFLSFLWLPWKSNLLCINLFALPRDEYSSHGANCSSSLRSGRITDYAEFSRRTDHVFISDGTKKCFFFFFFSELPYYLSVLF